MYLLELILEVQSDGFILIFERLHENWDNIQGHLLKNANQESISCLS